MILVGMLGLWGAYALGSWGWCLNRGYNVTLREWVSPLHPLDWSSGVKCIPPGSIFPKLNKGVACPTGTSTSTGTGTGGSTGSSYGGNQQRTVQTPQGSVPVTGVVSRYLG